MPAHPPQHLQAPETGQHDVEDHQRIAARQDALDACLTVVHRFQLEALRLQVLGEQFGQASIVVDGQDALHKSGS